MDSLPELTDPKAPPRGFNFTKAEAAKAQLETGIWLWFHYADPICILALAAGAFDCYEALGAHAGRASPFKTWLKAQPQSRQDRARDAINFIKHGRRNLTKSVPYMPIWAEAMMIDCIESHKHLCRARTHLMTLFVARWVIENPSEPNAAIGATITRAAKVYDLADRDRTQFLKKGMERLGTTPAPPT